MSKTLQKKLNHKEGFENSTGGESSEQLSHSNLAQMKKDAHLQMFAGEEKTENNTGLPDELKSGVEALSGQSMDDVKVHKNSAEPAKMGAHAFAQGSDIHLGSGAEKHLPHEAWHVAQQKQGRVQATTSVNGAAVNDDPALEKEADVMGAKAMQAQAKDGVSLKSTTISSSSAQLADADDPDDDKAADSTKVAEKAKKFAKALNNEFKNVKSSKGDADTIKNSTIAMLDIIISFSRVADPSLKNIAKKYKSTTSRVDVAEGKFKSIMKKMDSDFLGAFEKIPEAKEFADSYQKLSAQIFKESKKAS